MTTEKKKTATKKKPASKDKENPVVMSKDSIQISNLSSKSFSYVLRILEHLFETNRDLLDEITNDGRGWVCDGWKLDVWMLSGGNGRWIFMFTDISDDEKENQGVTK